MKRILIVIAFILSFCSCRNTGESGISYNNERPTFSNPIRQRGSSPSIIRHNGKYYYTQSNYVRVSLWCSETIEDLKTAEEHVVYSPENTYYISAPILRRLGDKWYIYYSSEGKDMSSREIHVLENPSDDPLQGAFTHKAVINTGNQKSIHPQIFENHGRSYLLWSGHDKAQEHEIDIFRIYIAELANPWTLASKPVAILSPKYEWECQWVSNNGLANKSPIYINEAPVAIHSRDSSKVLLYFAASLTQTSYYCEGMAIASAQSNLLNPESWTKLPEPVFFQNPEVSAYGAGHVSFFHSDSELYMIYQASPSTERTSIDNRSPHMQLISYDKTGIPQLGRPVDISVRFPEPY